MTKKKQSTKEIEKEIIQILTDAQGKVMNHKQIFSRIDKSDGENSADDILPILNNLAEQQEIQKKDNFKFVIAIKTVFVEGIIDISKNGRAYLTVEGMDEDLVVDNSLIKLMPLDKVQAVLTKKNKVEVVKLIEHSQKQFVGVLNKKNTYWYITPDSNKFRTPLDIKFSHHLKEGYKVVFKILGFPNDAKYARAEVITMLGKEGTHQTEMHAILAEFGLPEAFENEVNEAAERIKIDINQKEIADREDFRKTITFTIDPETAKDFDDAISFKPMSHGGFEVGVHIADVSHYVLPNDIVDMEAIKRATSVYLVDRVVPMLPFNLSDSICSLVPNEDRLTFSAIFEVSKEYQIINKRFTKSIIHSQKRFSYEEAQSIINAKEGVLYEELNILNEFAKYLTKKRFEKGALNFDSPEYRFVLDENFKPIEMTIKQRQDTNKLIEELMLLANRSVAEFVYTQKPRKPFVYRTHDEPNQTKLVELKKLVEKFGYKLHIDDEVSLRSSMNQLMKDVEGKPEQDMIQSLCIRSMSKAVYTPNKPSHYGLAFPYYTHFTSPIRRYPDIIVHRLLDGYLRGKSMQEICGWNNDMLDNACKHSSKMELTASEAERASIKYKQVEWMEDHIGETFDGIITGLTDFGMFVEIKSYKCDGLIRLNAMTDDHYDYDINSMSIVGRRYFKKYRIGDPLRVTLINANKKNRTIDLQIASYDKSGKKHGKSNKYRNGR